MRPVRSSGPAASRRTFRDPLILAFVLSGVAGLIYESIWSRYVALLVGHGAYAQVLVLVSFMGGMAGGALAVARRSETWRDPLLLYAAVEAIIGVLGLLFHPIFVVTTGWAYDRWFPALGGPPGVTIVQWGLAVLLVLPPSVLLGATFPLMSAAVLRRTPRQPGRTLATLYFANSLGAAAGGLIAGFWLVKLVGLPGTVMTAGALNLIAAGVAFGVARRSRPASIPAAVSPPPPPPASAGASAGRLLVVVAFGTAVASFVYEIAWIRMLSLVLGSATHSFELMLSAFILGLALGAFWCRSRADRFRHPLRALGVTQWVMGALALATLPLYAASFSWMAGLVAGLRGSPHGYETFSLARYGLCLAIMLPATCCAGITLPLLTRALLPSGGERAIGLVYGANTLGSIAGAALAGLVLLPWLGLERLLAAGAVLDMALGVALLARAETAATRRAALPALGGGLALAGLALGLVRLDPLVLASGVYRTGELLDPAATRVIFYRDGRTATVSVRRQTDGSLTLSTNGKPDASLPARWLSRAPQAPAPLSDDESTQLLAGLVSLAHAPGAKRAAVIGQGSGMTSHVLLGSARLEHLVTIEIEPEMIAGSRAFYPSNARVFDDPRSTFAIDDARSYLAATPERFDLIVSEPSNPWVSGVSGLFTDEFYRRVSAKLGASGVLGQWLHLYSLDDDLALSVLAGIHRHFTDYRAYLVSGSDMLVVASNRPGGLSPDWSEARQPGLAGETGRTFPFTPRVFDALRVADRQALGPLLARTPPNSDYFPALDLGAERARFDQRAAQGLLQLHEDRFGIAALGAPAVDPPPSALVPLPRVSRVRSLSWIARLRSALAGAVPPASEGGELDGRLAEAVARQHAIFASCASNAPPPDWRAWLYQALRGENERHTGTSGYADEDYFATLLRYAREQHAPPIVGQTLEWVRALDRRDMGRAAALTDTLLADTLGPQPWLTPEVLMDGGVMAELGAGDVAGGRRVFEALAPRASRASNDLRSRLMAARLATPAR